jgi:hypothetical protein
MCGNWPSRDGKIQGLTYSEPPMHDPNLCLSCALPFASVEWTEDLSGIGDDSTEWMTFVDDEVCLCTDEDRNE